MSSTSRRLAVTGLLCAVGTAAAVTAQAAAPSSPLVGRVTAGAVSAPVPVVTSPNVSLLTNVPLASAISMEFSRSTNHAYVSGLDKITVLDTTNPKAPVVKGVVVNALFENEAMTYGEQRGADGKLTQFVLAGVDQYQYSPETPSHVNVGGMEVAIVDVTDPTKPRIRSYVKTKTSSHTVQCVSTDCKYAYTAGGGSRFSILDLTDLDKPKEVLASDGGARGKSPASGPGGYGFTSGAGHYWDFDGVLGWHTGAGGAAAFDVSDPLNPKIVQATGALGRKTPYNDFILHNSLRPNASKFDPASTAEPSVMNGDVLLVTEEDYADDGDEVACDKAGSFQTWEIKDLDRATYLAAGGNGTKQDVGSITPLDISNIPNEFKGGTTTPAGAFCSAHWFDFHQDGFVAQGFYQQGLRIVDVRDARNIKQHGFSTSAATETWDAYFVPQRDASGVATGPKTNIVYTADAARGVDVYEVDLTK